MDWLQDLDWLQALFWAVVAFSIVTTIFAAWAIYRTTIAVARLFQMLGDSAL